MRISEMRRRVLSAALLLSGLALPGGAGAEARVRIVATDPAGESVTLGRDETFWVRVAYEADAPTHIWVRPYLHGQEVRVRSNPSRKHTGSGEALGWFASSEPYQVDEIRVRLGGGSPYREWDAASLPVKITGTTAPAAARTRAAWADELLHAEAEAQRRDVERQRSAPASASDRALVSGFMLSMLALLLAGVALPAWASWRWRGGWRLAAALPIAMMAFVVARIVVDTTRDPTSHNLWPFEIVMSGAASVASVVVLAFARRLLRVAG
jgi:hypothetical protein